MIILIVRDSEFKKSFLRCVENHVILPYDIKIHVQIKIYPLCRSREQRYVQYLTKMLMVANGMLSDDESYNFQVIIHYISGIVLLRVSTFQIQPVFELV